MIMKKVVIIGGGFGGLNVAKALKKAPCKVTLIDKKNHHLFQPLLYQTATAALSPSDIATPLREVLKNQVNTKVVMGTAEKIIKEKKEVVLENGEVVSYDYLVIATGAKHSYFGNSHWEKHAPGLKTINDALKIRENILISFEKAERLEKMKEVQAYLNFVIVGGGPTGVEMAGAIAEIAHKTLFKNFKKISPEKSKIYLIEGFDRVLPGFPKKLSDYAGKTLKKMGVTVMTSQMVSDITEQGVHVGDQFLESHNIIWAAGNEGSPLLKTLNTPLDKQGRAMVEKDLSLPKHPEIFVIGDTACVIRNNNPLPGVAPVAIQQGCYVGKVIRKGGPSKKRRPFKYFDKGGLATIGEHKAVGYFRKFLFSGFFAWAVWCFIHVAYLVSYRNRCAVMLDWCIHYISGARGARLIQRSIKKEQLLKRRADKKNR